MQWLSQAPSNIALIKYMGKKNHNQNIADNPSLSFTLQHLLTRVSLETHLGEHDYWEPLSLDFTLSAKAIQRYLKHLDVLKKNFSYAGFFILRSANNFPQGTGLASSASSFAALTSCALKAISELKSLPLPSIDEQAKLSRLGSGSSCRSFFSPWALWDGENVKSLDLPYTELSHQVILISKAEKQISSSLAHEYVKSSPLYRKRAQRATGNLESLIRALQTKNWYTAYQICWSEFQDMHELFHTASPTFSYMTDETSSLLEKLQKFWKQHKDGPLVTMDAGPNIHLLYRPDQTELAKLFSEKHLLGKYELL